MADQLDSKRRRLLEGGLGAALEPEASPAALRMQQGKERPPLCEFESYAKDCITFHLVHTVEDVENAGDTVFHPEFTHQQFGEDERIYGYNDLQINIWMHATTFMTYVNISYSAKATGRKKEVVDLRAILKEHFPAGFTESRGCFLEMLRLGAYSDGSEKVLKEKGTVVKSWQAERSEELSADERGDPTAPSTTCEIVRLELKDPLVREWHARVQPFVRFFIDNGQPIDSKDPLWELYVALERSNEGDPLKARQVSVAGFSTVYRFYHYPDSTRLRVSQVLVLPPFQGRGHGRQMLTVVNEAGIQRQCFDVTVEDASDDLQVLRETLDVLRLLENSRFVADAKESMAGEPGTATTSSAGDAEKAARGADGPAVGGVGSNGTADRVSGAEPNGGTVGQDREMLPGVDGEGIDGNIRFAGKEIGLEEGSTGREDSQADTAEKGKVEMQKGEPVRSKDSKEETEGLRSTPCRKWGEPSRELVEAARIELKISKQQLLRCWEVLLFLLLRGDHRGHVVRKAWERLVQERLYNEEFGGGKDEQDAKEKRVVELDYVHDGMQMFFMTKMRKRRHEKGGARVEGTEMKGHSSGLNTIAEEKGEEVEERGAGEAVLELRSPEEKAAAVKEGLKSFFEERLEQIGSIAKKVDRHYKGQLVEIPKAT